MAVAYEITDPIRGILLIRLVKVILAVAEDAAWQAGVLILLSSCREGILFYGTKEMIRKEYARGLSCLVDSRDTKLTKTVLHHRLDAGSTFEALHWVGILTM